LHAGQRTVIIPKIIPPKDIIAPTIKIGGIGSTPDIIPDIPDTNNPIKIIAYIMKRQVFGFLINRFVSSHILFFFYLF
jgi:hypothetical protein